MDNVEIPLVNKGKQQLLRFIRFGILLIAVVVVTHWVQLSTPLATAFQSPQPEVVPLTPLEWVFSGEDAVRVFGPVKVSLPQGFTKQGGATLISNMIVVPVGIEDAKTMIPGTEFALGIWPPNDQIRFEKPIGVQLTLNAAQVPPDITVITLVRYDPISERWVPMATQFNRATYQLSSSLQEFSPVPKDFSNWGGRTFFAAAKTGISADTPESVEAAVRSTANIRSGPGTNYSILRVARAGETVVPLFQSADGRWLYLADGTWIAAFLVNNAPQVPTAPTPLPFGVPTP